MPDTQEVLVAPGLPGAARRYLQLARPLDSKAVEAAIVELVGRYLELGLVLDEPPAVWTPSALLHAYDHLSVRLWHDRPYLMAAPAESRPTSNGLAIGLDQSLQGTTRVTSFALIEEAGSGRWDPEVFEFEWCQALGRRCWRWIFTRESREYRVEAWGPLVGAGPWTGRVSGIYTIGEPIDDAWTLVAYALDGPHKDRLPERRVEGGEIRLLEPADVVVAQEKKRFADPLAAFQWGIWQLPGSDEVVALGEPNGRLT